MSTSVEARSDSEATAPGSENGHPTDWINLLGVRISAVNMTTAGARVQEAIASGRKGYICIRDVHGIIRCQSDAELRRIHNRAFLVTPDGMPVAWALRLAGHRQADRVYGPDLMLALFEQGRRVGVRHFLYGATPEVLARLQATLVARFPGADIVGHHSPPFRELTADEERDVAARVNATGADIVWVGLGTPKQELWMGRMRSRLAASMLIGVGAAFDFHAGVKRQAPRLVQRSGFEWLFRLACEPRRLAWRYAVAVPNFIALSAAQALKLRSFPIQDDAPERAST